MKAKLLERYVRRELSCLNLTMAEAIFEAEYNFPALDTFRISVTMFNRTI